MELAHLPGTLWENAGEIFGDDASPLRGPMENAVSPLIGNFKTIVLQGSGNGAPFFAELPFLGIQKHMGSRDLGTDISVHREILVSWLRIWGIFLYGS
jgi:hypothetical protein